MTGVTTFCARYLPALAPLIVLLVLWRLPPHRRRLLLLRGAIVLIAGVALAKGSGAIHHEPRPFVVNHMVPLIPHAADNSFPSERARARQAFDEALAICTRCAEEEPTAFAAYLRMVVSSALKLTEATGQRPEEWPAVVEAQRILASLRS